MVATVHVYWFISIEIDERVVQFVVKQINSLLIFSSQ